MARRITVAHTVRQGEVWNRRTGTVQKDTVRVAKGQPGGGQFHGATNLRGTERV